MNGTQQLRASDQDRQQVVDRLRAAVGDGRLQMDEYMDRMGRAYQAVTLADLAPLCADLPASAPVAERDPAPAAIAAPLAGAWHRNLAGLPCVLRVMWSIWLIAVSINVVVWLLVTVTTGHLAYPWPLWVAGPYGAALFAISAAVTAFRTRQPAPRRVSAGRG
jgi:hypothetical protein